MGTIRELFFSWDAVRPYLGTIARGFLLTVRITFTALIFAALAGMMFAILRQARTAHAGRLRRIWFAVLRAVAVIYIDVFRGLPALLVIVLLYVSLPFSGIPVLEGLSDFWVGVLALSLVYAAYLAEIFRAGIESVERGQVEAARSLGMSNRQTLGRIVLPQAVRRVLPPLMNEFIILSKDTALLSTIAVSEVLGAARDAQAQTLNSTPLTAAAIFYLIFTLPLTRLVDRYIARERQRSGGGTVVIP
ncbi:MAG: amino acid ABC transporter permease [Actinobacteria bacterium]|nr:amino acid ABC transporter permease [Thermoleophilia bacterium]MCB9010505.1 amino acid ABC transporter permease [Actinomycetota bacterium]MCB9010617.1 amino acid ABC transporter permease [Actinomycetota bacterium]